MLLLYEPLLLVLWSFISPRYVFFFFFHSFIQSVHSICSFSKIHRHRRRKDTLALSECRWSKWRQNKKCQCKCEKSTAVCSYCINAYVHHNVFIIYNYHSAKKQKKGSILSPISNLVALNIAFIIFMGHEMKLMHGRTHKSPTIHAHY